MLIAPARPPVRQPVPDVALVKAMEDIAAIKKDIASLKNDVAFLKNEIASLRKPVRKPVSQLDGWLE